MPPRMARIRKLGELCDLPYPPQQLMLPHSTDNPQPSRTRNCYKPLRAEICAASTSSVALGSAWNCRVTRAATVLTARSEAICGLCVRALLGLTVIVSVNHRGWG